MVSPMTIPDNLVEIAARIIDPLAFKALADTQMPDAGREAWKIQADAAIARARAALSAVAPQIERDAIERCAVAASLSMCVTGSPDREHILASIRALSPQEGEGNG